MIHAEARAIVERVLAPVRLEQFMEGLDRPPYLVPGGPGHPRAALFGADPARAVLAAHATHATRIGSHAEGATLPPPPAMPAGSMEAFAATISAFHDRGYTVHVPDVIELSPPLARFARALEHLLHQPVKASLFWSRAGARAPVHYDDRENLVIQLTGTKRWTISADQPSIHNDWREVAEPQPQLGRAGTLETAPGDLLFVPRGLPHRVDALTDSLHLSVTVMPLTVREAIMAVLDHVSEADRGLRETALRQPLSPDRPFAPEALAALVRDGLARLADRAATPGVIEQALRHRSSRVIAGLRVSPSAPAPAVLTSATMIEHGPLAICHLIATAHAIDLSLPGGRITVHAAAGPALAFIARTPVFRIAELPGGLPDEVRIALVRRLIDAGFLQAAMPAPA